MRTPSPTLLLSVAIALACGGGTNGGAGRSPDGGETVTTETGAATSDEGAGADAEQMRRLAVQVTQRGLRLRQGDVVMIAGGLHSIPAMEALSLETAKAGGLYNMMLFSERVTRAELREVPEEHFGVSGAYFADWLRSTTVYIGLPSSADPKGTFADVPEARLAKWNARFASIYDMLNNSKVRGTYIDYPSPGAAAVVGMDPDAFARMQLAAIGADPDAMARAGKALEERFRKARTVRITSPAGTDLKVSLAGRPGIVDAGMLAPGAEQEKLFAKRWFVLPGGNFGVAPNETSASGVIVTPRDICKFGPVREARYEFAEGALTAVKAKEGQACLEEQLSPYGRGIRRIGSLGIGLNPELQVVEDGGDYRPWNAAGLVAVFLGDNTLMGGTNKVAGAVGIGLPITHATLEVDGEVVVRDGRLAGSAMAAEQ